MKWSCRTQEIRNEDVILVGKPEARRPVRRSRRGQEDNIKVNRRKIGFENMKWIRGGSENGSVTISCEPFSSIKDG